MEVTSNNNQYLLFDASSDRKDVRELCVNQIFNKYYN